ncbi:MAG: hypothetical protein LUG98_13210 [Tannerellaceae bacterium]|nr:hypothetical protein [Tannerellaceae bacterium]
MKHLESILSFILALAGIVFTPRRKRKPPCCPCPYVDAEEPVPKKPLREEFPDETE